MPLDYGAGDILLSQSFSDAESDFLNSVMPEVPGKLIPSFDMIFVSSTQAYREGLLGCTIARIQDRSINIRLPYVKHGPLAYNGRTLDERVVNPFLQKHRIPASRGPFLSAFRRGIEFDQSTTRGLKDIKGYLAFLELIGYLEYEASEDRLLEFLRYLLFRFAQLRESSVVPLSKLDRISLEQYGSLVESLLATPSGGRIPVILVVAMIRTIKEYFGLDWMIDHQGINVADSQTGVGGDITITSQGTIVLAIEVTERPMEQPRVAATFNSKIAPHGIHDYIFFIQPDALSEDARKQARQYFAQGHEINFLVIGNWVLTSLGTVGARGRAIFNTKLLELLGEQTVPRSVKVAWNRHIADITSATRL
jgi:hypothetical protein